MKFIVVTTINSPTHGMIELARGAAQFGHRFVIIGDKKSPPDFSLDNSDYYDIASQVATGLDFAKAVPMGHYARKNVGYLIAIKNGASSIVETDDDNIPKPEFWFDRSERQQVKTISDSRWVNVYSYFTQTPIWPRGLPLNEIQVRPPALDACPMSVVDCPVQQGLADDNPDVDAIFRLAFPLPLKFTHEPLSIALTDGAWSPFNSQNTVWHAQAFPLMYLPYHCSFRMTDIWRSFVVQRVLYANGLGILYHEPTVYQERNEHDLMKDFADEVVGYLNNREIRDTLLALPLKGGEDHFLHDMEQCYFALIEMGMIGKEEIALLAAWRRDIEDIMRKKLP